MTRRDVMFLAAGLALGVSVAAADEPTVTLTDPEFEDNFGGVWGELVESPVDAGLADPAAMMTLEQVRPASGYVEPVDVPLPVYVQQIDSGASDVSVGSVWASGLPRRPRPSALAVRLDARPGGAR